MGNYIFGYGSLINKASRNKTDETGKVIAVRVKGIQRAWNLPIKQFGATAVGATLAPIAICNGVLIPVSQDQLLSFDSREIKHGYSRIKLNHQDVSSIFNQKIPPGEIWVYLTNQPGVPSADTPIIQSYLDVIMTGCLSFSVDFAREFVGSTIGWDAPWLNDRDNPRYIRAMSNVPLKKEIDDILAELLSQEYRQRI